MALFSRKLPAPLINLTNWWLSLPKKRRIKIGIGCSLFASLTYRVFYILIRKLVGHPWDELVMFVGDSILIGLIAILVTILFQGKKQLEEQNIQLEKLAIKDPLTGLFNRNYIEQQRLIIESTSDRLRLPISVAVIDLDDLKVTNDNHGHSVGDALLKTTATQLLNCVRSSDIVARIGGDEYLILLFHKHGDNRAACEEVIRQRLSRFVFINETGASIGFATMHPGMSLKETMDLADKAMYEDKARRKNEKKDR